MKSIIMRITLFTMLLLTFAIASTHAATGRGLDIKSKEDLNHKSGKLGAYRALVIGINNYQDKKIPALKTAVHDAKEFARLLQTRYGFQVTLLLDRQATRQAIMDKMRYLVANTSPDESVLIYYAGHGDLDRVLNDGWWIPADAIGGNPATYLDNNYVHRVMKSMNARHVLLVSDSCYSGTLFGESRTLPAVIDDRYYLNLYNERSRWGITSGNKTPVSDSGSEGHSIFAYQLIKTLENNEKPYITTQEIYSQIAPIVANNSEQQPLCSPVRDTGDQGGGFVFVAATTPSYLKKSAQRPESDDLLRLRESLEREKQELERMKALYAEREKLAAERRRLEAENQQLVMGPLSSSVETKAKAEAEERARAEAAAKAKAEEIARAKAKTDAIDKAKAEENARAKTEADELAQKKAALEREKQQLAMANRPSQSQAGEIGRDGRFIAYNNETVLDTRTNLMWAAKDNGYNINWANAKSYCENYRGGGYSDWRMPTQDEVVGLYDNTKTYKSACGQDVHLTELIRLTCSWSWASETRGTDAAFFDFCYGNRFWFHQSGVVNGRALPVRSGK